MWGKGKGCRLRAFARENSKYEKFKKKRENARIYIGLLKNWDPAPSGVCCYY